jgi:hypothetical protein
MAAALRKSCLSATVTRATKRWLLSDFSVAGTRQMFTSVAHKSRTDYQAPRRRGHLDTVLTGGLAAIAPERCFGAPRRRKSPQNPPTRMSAVRGAGFPACRFRRLSSRVCLHGPFTKSKTVSSCAPGRQEDQLVEQPAVGFFAEFGNRYLSTLLKKWTFEWNFFIRCWYNPHRNGQRISHPECQMILTLLNTS